MFRLIHKNKKGFSFVELMTVIVVLSFVLPLAAQIIFQTLNVYKKASERWEVQSAVRLSCRLFESRREYITNAETALTYYDEALDKTQGAVCDDDGNIVSWRGTRPTVLPENADRTASPSDPNSARNPYTYIFSVPSYNSSGEYLGTFLYESKPTDTEFKRFMGQFGFSDVPVDVQFSVADNTSHSMKQDQDNPDSPAEPDIIPTRYLANTLNIVFTGDNMTGEAYRLETQFSLAAKDLDSKINMAGDEYVPKYFKDSSTALNKMEAFKDSDTAGIAGWNNEHIKEQITKDLAGVSASDPNAVKAVYTEKACPQPEVGKYVEKPANVLAFITTENMGHSGSTADLTANMQMPDCWSTWNFSEPTKLASHVLGGLRDFRDNVLAGTAFGDWFIHEYYNTWSPFLIKHTEFLKPLYRIILIPVSFVCGVVANS